MPDAAGELPSETYPPGVPPHGRKAVRVVLLSPTSGVLLFEGRDLSEASDAGAFWFTVGGGVDEGESLAKAAEREVLEETDARGTHPSPGVRLPRSR